MKKGIDWLSSTINCQHYDFLPFKQQLVPIVKFHSIPGPPSAGSYQNLNKWFWRTSFSDRYSSGTTGKMDIDIQTMINIRNGSDLTLKSYNLTLNEDELIFTKFSKGNPLTRAFLLLMGKSSPKDLISNTLIDIGHALSKYNRKEYHHVFPKAFLKSINVEEDQINSIVNFCFLSSQSNKVISRKEPSNYIFELIEVNNRKTILQSNLLPVEDEIYRDNDFEKFLHERARLIIENIKEKT